MNSKERAYEKEQKALSALHEVLDPLITDISTRNKLRRRLTNYRSAAVETGYWSGFEEMLDRLEWIKDPDCWDQLDGG